jgi:hypothetical protein
MSDMSRAIRGQLERYGARLSDVPTETLQDLVAIVEALGADMRGELDKRPPPGAEASIGHHAREILRLTRHQVRYLEPDARKRLEQMAMLP